jgi:hypothetical protein
MEYSLYNNTYIEEDNNDFILESNIKNNNLTKLNNCDNLILKKKKLIEISKNLTKIEYLEIFNILNEDKCVYSENKNGVFINLSNVSELTLNKIFDFINFIKHKKEDLIKHEEILNNAKKNISNEVCKNIENIQSSENNKDFEYKDSEYDYVEKDEEEKNNNYLVFSSDEDDDIENKISLKKKKIKYSGKKAKMIKSIKDSNDTNKIKNRFKKSEE